MTPGSGDGPGSRTERAPAPTARANTDPISGVASAKCPYPRVASASIGVAGWVPATCNWRILPPRLTRAPAT